MDAFLNLGALIGAICGILHAPVVYRNRVEHEGAGPARAAYFAVWAFALWALFGAYLLFFWCLGAVCIGVARLRQPT